MKKRELMLDFTSLLDVILILLFIVIANMNQASLAVGDELTAQLTQADTKVQTLEEEREELISQLEEMRINEADNAALQQQLEQMEESYAALQEEYDHLKIITDYDEDDISVYQAAIEKTTRVVLMCDTELNTVTGNQEVTVDIYLDRGGEGNQSYVSSVVLVHDFNLSGAERERLWADQTVDMTMALSAALRENTGRMAWLSIQYHYDDKNFANSDIEIIKKAIENLEHSFGIPCYAEEMKIY
ncbi:MAG: hypothetical protein IJC24_01705 [Clostridia bacterium]|nr:hypothetical protein [Clostridia bacterium]